VERGEWRVDSLDVLYSTAAKFRTIEDFYKQKTENRKLKTENRQPTTDNL